MPSLFVIRGRDQGRYFALEPKPTRIGRDPASAIQLIDSEVSRSHAELRPRSDGRLELVDLDSSNGTMVNGEKIERCELRSGDRVQIGQTLMIFTGSGSPGSMQAAHSVDIVMQSQVPEASRIVSSWPQSPSSLRVPSSLRAASGAAAGSGERAADGRDAAEVPLVETDEGIRRDLENRSLDVMYQTAIAVGRTMDIPELLDRILRLIFDWVEADRGCIMLRDTETDSLRPAARCDRDNQPPDRMSISRTILDFVMERKEGVRTTDARDDARWDAAHSIVQMGIREALCVPLLGRYGCVGAIYVDTFTSPGGVIARQQVGRFTDEHLRLMTAIGHQAALAIEDTFYYSSLLQSERLAAIGQTIAILSHHMKNILQGMRGGGYLIGAGLEREDPDAIRRGWQIVEKNQERISNLVLDMLSYSKDRQPERTTSDLNATVADVVELMQVRAEEQGCRLEFSPGKALPDAEFDTEAMHRAVLNLVTNAIDAVAGVEEARVAVRTGFAATDGWWIEVSDNGPGIDPEDREKVFSLFESKKGARGTGLGLPVSQKIVHEHGGRIDLMTEGGPGCTFRITLPPADAHQTRFDAGETIG
ncbi:ATP-binding protein [Candidatus Laterigemmans baculatus]|uniref:ATP-binding protein n=1 Tax=Candidatus Laterigemmans baculatus TaxID=2770505 RepID=UPI0013DD7B1F|nr:ATP-binding protein [Candidatus Laterigemmans baculatus]